MRLGWLSSLKYQAAYAFQNILELNVEKSFLVRKSPSFSEVPFHNSASRAKNSWPSAVYAGQGYIHNGM